MSHMIPLFKLVPHPDNPPARVADVAELAASIRAAGVLQPLTVEPHPDYPDRFVVVDGNRRHRAAQHLALDEVPCDIRPPRTRRVHNRDRLLFNGHRLAMTPLEQANAFQEMLAEGMTQTAVAARTGYSIGHVSARLALLELDNSTQRLVASGQIGADVALKAVRSARGNTGMGKKKALPHFSVHHPLAGEAAQACRAAHPNVGRVGGVACGPCWEQTIRKDEGIRIPGEALGIAREADR